VTSQRKAYFIDQLMEHYREVIAGAHGAESSAGQAVEEIRAEARNKDDAKGAIEAGRMAVAHRKRRQRARRELEALIAFASRGVKDYAPTAAIGLGALVDVSVEADDGSEERTLFLLPVGAGTELNGPGGDGFISVIGPDSPLGRGLYGARAGDEVEIVIAGRDREWAIVDVC
jgi:transcription elongation GreA/GreB family factor